MARGWMYKQSPKFAGGFYVKKDLRWKQHSEPQWQSELRSKTQLPACINDLGASSSVGQELDTDCNILTNESLVI